MILQTTKECQKESKSIFYQNIFIIPLSRVRKLKNKTKNEGVALGQILAKPPLGQIGHPQTCHESGSTALLTKMRIAGHSYWSKFGLKGWLEPPLHIYIYI
jgi:hypothetical protein